MKAFLFGVVALFASWGLGVFLDPGDGGALFWMLGAFGGGIFAIGFWEMLTRQ